MEVCSSLQSQTCLHAFTLDTDCRSDSLLLTVVARVHLGLIPVHVSHNVLEPRFHGILEGRKVGIPHAILSRTFGDDSLGALTQTAIAATLNALEEDLDKYEKELAFAKDSVDRDCRTSTHLILLKLELCYSIRIEEQSTRMGGTVR
jgi:hypothetical protein